MTATGLTSGSRAEFARRAPKPEAPLPAAGVDTPVRPVRLFLCGDVMTGRGIDQILRQSVHPRLHEPYITDARAYVHLAETASGRIPRPVDTAYVWGEALAALHSIAPAVRIANLETVITARGEPWPGKSIHYRMHPANTSLLQVAGIDCCVLANNHILDWGHAGLAETTATLAAAGIRCAGAGRNKAAAQAPAELPLAGGGRVLVFGLASTSSGVPPAWAAGDSRPGVHLIDESSTQDRQAVTTLISRHRRPGDIVVVSVHWGGNWGYAIPPDQAAFAHALIDTGLVDMLHGHSSHHAKGIEVYRGRPVIYGCGDLLNDYEGIRGYEAYRAGLSLMYFPALQAADGGLLDLFMVPMRIRRFRLQRAGANDADWLLETMDRQCRLLGTRVGRHRDGRFELGWDALPAGR